MAVNDRRFWYYLILYLTERGEEELVWYPSLHSAPISRSPADKSDIKASSTCEPYVVSDDIEILLTTTDPD